MDSDQIIRNAKRAKEARRMLGAFGSGGAAAEKEFPKILEAIEQSAPVGICYWIIDYSLYPGTSYDWHEFCRGFAKKVLLLINDTDFSTEISGKYLVIKW